MKTKAIQYKVVLSVLVLSLLMAFYPVLPASATESDSNFRYGETQVSTVLNTVYRTITTTPGGQPPEGRRFQDGGGFYISTTGGGSVAFSVGVPWGYTTISATIGYTISGGGVYTSVPNTTDYFIAKIDKKYKIERLKIDHYQYGQYQYTDYYDRKTWISEVVYVVRV